MSDPASPAPNPSPPRACFCGKSSACPLCKVAARRWNPYVAGALIGLLSWVTFYASDKALGTSTTMVHLAALVTGAVAPDTVTGAAANPYYASELNDAKNKTMFDWQFLLVVGVFLGAFAASRFESPRFVEHVPALWRYRFGPSRARRYAAAFVGGAVLLFGARLAGGCTSGHGISGGLQFAVSSWVFFLAMFASGVAAAFALFGLNGRNHVDA